MSCNDFSLNPTLTVSLNLAASPCELPLNPTLTVSVVPSVCERDFGLSLNPSITVSVDIAVYRLILKVLDHNDAPVSGASIIVEDISSGTSHSYLTDDSGTAVVDVRGPGLYRVTARKSGKKRAVREYEVGGIVHDTLVLEPTKLTVIVLDPQNRPVSGATVRVYMDGNLIAEDITR